jgi:hypothetical protein
MAKSFRAYKQKNLGTTNFCTVSKVTTASTGINNAAAIATAEYEDGVVIISVSSASSGGGTSATYETITLKNFPYKFEIIDAWYVNRRARVTLYPIVRVFKGSVTIASTIFSLASLKTANVIHRPTVINPLYTAIDKTDSIKVRVTSGTKNLGYSFKAYLRVIPARS